MHKSQTFTLKDGRKLGFVEYGVPWGKPVFFFHGWPGSRLSGKETDIAAKKLGVRIISPERPGIGLSSFQKDRKLLDWPDDVISLANHLKIKKFSVMGVSGGGPYVAVCAYKIPDRITKSAIVVGLGPINIKGGLKGVGFRSRLGWENYHKFPFLRTASSLISLVMYKYFPISGKLFAFPSSQDRAILRDLIAKGKGKGIQEPFKQGIKGVEHELKIYTDDWGFALKNIKVKTYLWYGAKDESVSLNMGKYYHSQIKNSELFVDPDASHLSRYYFEEKILNLLI